MAHASDMTRPTKLSVPDVDIDCLEPQPASELRVADVVIIIDITIRIPKLFGIFCVCQIV